MRKRRRSAKARLYTAPHTQERERESERVWMEEVKQGKPEWVESQQEEVREWERDTKEGGESGGQIKGGSTALAAKHGPIYKKGGMSLKPTFPRILCFFMSITQCSTWV